MSDIEHTQTPWRVEECTDLIWGECSGERMGLPIVVGQIPSYWQAGNPNMDTREANAARIVACVNACDGIDNAALDAGVIAEIQSALKLWLDYDNCDEADFTEIGPMCLYANAIEATRAALAKLGQKS